MKRVLCFLFSVFLGWTAYAAQVVNVEYIHDLILQKWNISVPYNSALNNTQAVANMKYLLTSVDVANAMLNGGAITDWGNSTYATNQVADTVAANQVIANLIKLPIGEYPFEIKTTKDTTYFSFSMSAKGSFVVNWGDGNIEVITNPDTSTVTYDHTYNVAKNYTIGIKGTATAYSNGSSTPVISFDGNENISMIFGSVGQVFPTLANGTNPKFYYTFANLPNISGGIPSTLFSGITGVPAKNMFYGTFYGSAGLTGGIPGTLFSGLDGAPTEGIFYRTFEKCTGLSGPIPSDLFAGIHGTPARDMFHSTFSGCKGLTAIPDGLFAGINGAPAQRMYNATFYECSGITSNIPDKLFGTFNGAPQELMFGNTFHGCTNLTGKIPVDLFAGITGAPIQRMFEGTFSMCSGLTGQIPANLFSSMRGAPAASMFYNTFTGCSGLTGTVPAGLFATFSGAPAQRMFNKTFYNCNQLTGIDSGVFGELSGDAQAGMFEEMFNRATALRGPSAKIGSKYLYEIWPDATSAQVGKMYSGANGLSDYNCIPSAWGGGGHNCLWTDPT